MPRKGGSISILQQKNEKLIQHSTSDKMSICTECGKPFAQAWRPEYEAYTSFHTCPDCRIAHMNGGMKVEVEFNPTPWQQKVHASDARYKIIAGGIRSGKDRYSNMAGIDYFVRCLNEERSNDMVPYVLWWLIAPWEKTANQNWRELLQYFPKELVVDVSKTTKTIQTINGGIIEVHSAYDPESLVAVGLDLVTITEAARIADMEEVWANLEGRLNSPGRGLGGKGGHAIINSSPLGMNYFYKMWRWGKKNTNDYDPDFESWQVETWDNPYMAKWGNSIAKNGKTRKENLMKRMSKKRYEQDYLAKFIDTVNKVFPHIDKCFVKTPEHLKTENEINEYWKEWEEPEPFETYAIGYDPAKSMDEPIVWIRNSKGRVVKIDNLSGLDWDGQWDRIAFYSKLYNGATCYFGKTGLGEVIESQLTNRGVPNAPLDEQGRNKEKLVENMMVVVEQQWCQIPWSQEVENQFNDYTSVSRKTGSTQYGNESNDGHDDHVSAAYFCFSAFVVEEQSIPYVGYMGEIKKAI